MHFEPADEYSTPSIFFSQLSKDDRSKQHLNQAFCPHHWLKDTFKVSRHKKLDYLGIAIRRISDNSSNFECKGLPARGKYIGSKYHIEELHCTLHLLQVKKCILRWDDAANGELIHCNEDANLIRPPHLSG